MLDLDTRRAIFQLKGRGRPLLAHLCAGSGTELALNGKPIGVEEGADFVAAYFRIWLGETPIDTRLRDQLLGCERRDSNKPGCTPAVGIDFVPANPPTHQEF